MESKRKIAKASRTARKSMPLDWSPQDQNFTPCQSNEIPDSSNFKVLFQGRDMKPTKFEMKHMATNTLTQQATLTKCSNS